MRQHPERTAPTILVPLDGSRLAEAVLPAVEALATRAHARVVVLHVLERNPPATVHGERHLRTLVEALEYEEDVSRRLRTAGVQEVHMHVHDAPETDVARSIAVHAEEHRADLVVLCTHGGGGLRDLLFGSIAQQALQHGKLSILLVRPPAAGATPTFEVRCVLVPVDGTPAHEPALDAALFIARMFSASIYLAMVIPTLATLSGGQAVSGMMLPSTTKAVLDLAEQNAVDYLERMRERCQREQVEATYEVLRGDPVLAVLDLARRIHASLIVMGSHGRAGLDALLAGSVAKRITDKVTTPILLVRVSDAAQGELAAPGTSGR
jgi:nucleotide-binding universal stress UspA family protein